jgi:replication fork clamp-binding protein CrfC
VHVCTPIQEVIGSNGIAFTQPELEIFFRDIKEFIKEVQEEQARQAWRQKERQKRYKSWHTEKLQEERRSPEGDAKGGRCVS